MTFKEILDDLTSRFIINVPDEELSSIQRVCFQIEQAHWYYEDFVREVNPSLPTLKLKNFSLQLIKECELLSHWADDHEAAFATFLKYKTKVPVCGAVILNEKMDKVLLVRGWKANACWGFPKGKINQNESETNCAIREVFEETGQDTSRYLREEEYIERVENNQRIRLYIIHGLGEDTNFNTQTRKEIGDIKWHRLNAIPGFSVKGLSAQEKRASISVTTSSKKFKFFMVGPFMPSIRRWIQKFRKARREGTERRNAALRVVMDAVSDNEEVEEEEEGGVDFAGEYSGFVPASEQVTIEKSLKMLLGIGSNGTNDDWKLVDKISHLPDVRHSQIIPFGQEPSMEIIANPSFVPNQQKRESTKKENELSKETLLKTEKKSDGGSKSNELLDILLNGSIPPQPKTNESVSKPKQKNTPRGKQTKAEELFSFITKETPPKPKSGSVFEPTAILKNPLHEEKNYKQQIEKQKTKEELISEIVSPRATFSPAAARSSVPSITGTPIVSHGSRDGPSLLDILEDAPAPPVHDNLEMERAASLKVKQEEHEELLSILMDTSVSSAPIDKDFKSRSLLDILVGGDLPAGVVEGVRLNSPLDY